MDLLDFRDIVTLFLSFQLSLYIPLILLLSLCQPSLIKEISEYYGYQIKVIRIGTSDFEKYVTTERCFEEITLANPPLEVPERRVAIEDGFVLHLVKQVLSSLV